MQENPPCPGCEEIRARTFCESCILMQSRCTCGEQATRWFWLDKYQPRAYFCGNQDCLPFIEADGQLYWKIPQKEMKHGTA